MTTPVPPSATPPAVSRVGRAWRALGGPSGATLITLVALVLSTGATVITQVISSADERARIAATRDQRVADERPAIYAQALADALTARRATYAVALAFSRLNRPVSRDDFSSLAEPANVARGTLRTDISAVRLYTCTEEGSAAAKAVSDLQSAIDDDLYVKINDEIARTEEAARNSAPDPDVQAYDDIRETIADRLEDEMDPVVDNLAVTLNADLDRC